MNKLVWTGSIGRKGISGKGKEGTGTREGNCKTIIALDIGNRSSHEQAMNNSVKEITFQ